MSAPFSITVAPNLEAARRTDSSRWASISPASVESRPASSPECGVITVTPARSNGSSDQSASASSTTGTRSCSSRTLTRSRVPSLRPRPGPEHDRVRALGGLEHRVGRARKQPAGGVLRERPLDGFEHPRLDRRERRLGRGDGDVARVGAERGEGRESRRPRLSGRAADDEHRAGAVLVALRGLARHVVECRGLDEPVLERHGLEPDRRDMHEARVEASGRDRETDLRRAEGDGRHRPAPPRRGPRRSRRSRRRERRPPRPAFRRR